MGRRKAAGAGTDQRETFDVQGGRRRRGKNEQEKECERAGREAGFPAPTPARPGRGAKAGGAERTTAAAGPAALQFGSGAGAPGELVEDAEKLRRVFL